MFLHGHRFTRPLRVIALVLVVLGSAACGKKGPLYMPDDDKRPPAPTPTPVPVQ